MRRKLIFGNWKMNKTRDEARAFAESCDGLAMIAKRNNIDIGVAPTFTALHKVKKIGPSNLIVAAQNVHFEDHGAFTGEISIPMLKDIDVDWVILGHSERRAYDNETSEKCNKKMKAMIANGMTPIYCVGETLAQFDEGKTKEVVGEQVRVGFADLKAEDVKDFVVAYEPVWSIGTGKNASKEIAQDVCSFIREVLREMVGDAADTIRILYGGSVKPENVRDYLTQPDVDGALVGGASLKVDSFAQLVNNIL